MNAGAGRRAVMAEELLDLGDVWLCVETFGDGAASDPVADRREPPSPWTGGSPAWCPELAAGGSPHRPLRPPGHRPVRRRAHRAGRRTPRRRARLPTRCASSTRSACRAPTWSGCRWARAIAQELAARHPERVATLTLIAHHPGRRVGPRHPLPGPEPRSRRRSTTRVPEPDWVGPGRRGDHLVEVLPAVRRVARLRRSGDPAARRAGRSTGRPTSRRHSKNHWLLAGDDEASSRWPTSRRPPSCSTGPPTRCSRSRTERRSAREIAGAILLPMPGMGHERPPGPLRGRRPPRRSCATPRLGLRCRRAGRPGGG